MAARPGALLIQKWVCRIKEKLDHASSEKIANAKWDFVGNSITNTLFDNSSSTLVTRLEKNHYAFTPEILHFQNRGTAVEQYRNFWFGLRKQEAPFYQNQFLIALHNSWTPDWYKQLTEDEVLEADCLLSKTLKNTLDGNHHKMQKQTISLSLRAALLYQKVKKRLF